MKPMTVAMATKTPAEMSAMKTGCKTPELTFVMASTEASKLSEFKNQKSTGSTIIARQRTDVTKLKKKW